VATSVPEHNFDVLQVYCYWGATLEDLRTTLARLLDVTWTIKSSAKIRIHEARKTWQEVTVHSDPSFPCQSYNISRSSKRTSTVKQRCTPPSPTILTRNSPSTAILTCDVQEMWQARTRRTDRMNGQGSDAP
jgi:hypothetical protein